MSKPGAPAGGSSTETVKVMVRCRPMNTKEKTKGKYSSHINYSIFLAMRVEIWGKLSSNS
jgi:hypothetical protein